MSPIMCRKGMSTMSAILGWEGVGTMPPIMCWILWDNAWDTMPPIMCRKGMSTMPPIVGKEVLGTVHQIKIRHKGLGHYTICLSLYIYTLY